MSSGLIWLILAAVLFIIELLTPVFLFSLFSVAALVASLFAFAFPHLTYIQLLIFIVLSFVLILFVRKIVMKYFIKDDKNGAKSNVDSMIGKRCRVVESINNAENTGICVIDDVRWRSLGENGDIIKENTFCIIVKVESARLYVKKAE